MPILDDIREVRSAPVIDGELHCWRCDGTTDDAGFCDSCGGVTLPVAGGPLPDTSSTAAVGRIAPELEHDPLPSFNALGHAAIGDLGCEV